MRKVLLIILSCLAMGIVSFTWYGYLALIAVLVKELDPWLVGVIYVVVVTLAFKPFLKVQYLVNIPSIALAKGNNWLCVIPSIIVSLGATTFFTHTFWNKVDSLNYTYPNIGIRIAASVCMILMMVFYTTMFVGMIRNITRNGIP